jgi:very-short-patch-repair endonuclease
MRRVTVLASPEKANPFESGLHAIAAQVPGLRVRPQVSIYDPHFLGRPDLVDERLGIALEADSFEWHGSRAALRRDARRYDELVVHGWLVLRLAWEDVMFDQPWVDSVLRAAVAERSDQRCWPCHAA